MNIEKFYISGFETRFKHYFNINNIAGWKDKFSKNAMKIDHDEPWLTLIAIYSILGSNPIDNNCRKVEALNGVLKDIGLKDALSFDSVTEVILEEKLPEIKRYRTELKDKYAKENFHLYPDRRETINKKLLSDKSSIEGNTNLDLKILGESNGKKIVLFIEAKFLSDISYQITYNPVRDQIARIIDCGIDLIEDGDKKPDSYSNFYFLLLTPKVFRNKSFGERKFSGLNEFVPERSRLYNFKMEDYKNPIFLKQALPHRTDISETDWQTIADNIGWITYDDFFQKAIEFNTFESEEEKKEIVEFATERNLL